jgi:hypothetical protein
MKKKSMDEVEELVKSCMEVMNKDFDRASDSVILDWPEIFIKSWRETMKKEGTLLMVMKKKSGNEVEIL